MVTTSRRPGFTLVELLVVIAIIGILIALLFPAIAAVQETAKKAACVSNMRQFYFAMQSFQESYRRYPPSCKYARGSSTAGGGAAAAGNTKYESWSWIALLLPYLGREDTAQLLTIKNGLPWVEPSKTVEKHKMARETVLKELLCPSRSGSQQYEGPMAKGFKTEEKEIYNGALTNYKGMGATVRESLPFRILAGNQTGSSAVKSSLTPPYGDKGDHPDGVLFPAEDGIRPNDIVDSQATTIMIAETREEKYARWIFGTEATLVGLPSEEDPARCGVKIVNNTTYNHYAPQGWDGKFDGESEIPETVKTYLNYDYTQLTNKYDTEREIKYGPSSRHPGIVNHLFCDGQVRNLAVDTDVAAYMFMITRKGGEQIQKWMSDRGF